MSGDWPPPQPPQPPPSASFPPPTTFGDPTPNPDRPNVSPSEVRPHRTWYVLAAVLPALGIAAAILLVVLAVSGAISDIDEVDLGSEGVATLQVEAGEERGLYFDDASGASTRCQMAERSGGPIELRGLGSSSFTVNEWEAFARFTPRTDAVLLRCQGTAPVAVGPSPDIAGLLGTVGGALALIFGGIIAGVVLAVVIAVRRRKDRERRRSELTAPFLSS